MANQTFDLTPETTFKGNICITVKKGFTKPKNAFSKTESLQREPCRKKKQKKNMRTNNLASTNLRWFVPQPGHVCVKLVYRWLPSLAKLV